MSDAHQDEEGALRDRGKVSLARVVSVYGTFPSEPIDMVAIRQAATEEANKLRERSDFGRPRQRR